MDAAGKPITADSVNLTYDALGRMVEQARGTSYTEIVYAPTGDKLALMNGQTLQKAFVPLLGQATAIYASTGLDHYRHSDWLGSARLTSSPARAYVSSVAYAPYGETYASSGTTDPSFTGQNPDTVSNDYDFFFREYSTEGRWASPDPAGLDAVDPTNPQSWNRYAYVVDNPLALTDLLGLFRYVPCAPGNPPCSMRLPSLDDWGFTWPCFGFLSTGPGPDCPQAPQPPPPPQRVNPLKEPCVMTNSFADHQNRTPPSTLPGVDLRTAKGNGTSVFSPVDGTIGRTRSNGTRGGRENFVSVQEQGTGLLVYLVHVSPLANLPTSVTAGQQVGVTDNTGKQTAPHLHLAVRDKQGNLVDPVGAGFVPNCKVK